MVFHGSGNGSAEVAASQGTKRTKGSDFSEGDGFATTQFHQEITAIAAKFALLYSMDIANLAAAVLDLFFGDVLEIKISQAKLDKSLR